MMEIQDVPVGAIFQHYRNKKKYKILAIARHTEEEQLYVVYQGLYCCETFGDQPIWVRPLAMFLEKVDQGGEQVPRFLRVELSTGINA